jgi:hypothetical protein
MVAKWIARLINRAAARPAVASQRAGSSLSTPAQVREASLVFNQTPDEPEPFGFKVSWFAVKTSDPAAVVDALELTDATPSNWESGLAAVYSQQKDERWAFISPPISGWVLAISSDRS